MSLSDSPDAEVHHAVLTRVPDALDGDGVDLERVIRELDRYDRDFPKLAPLRHMDIHPRLFEAIEKGPASRRIAAIRVVASRKQTLARAAWVLVKAMTDEDTGVCSAAICALRDLDLRSDPEIIPLLIDAMQHRSQEIRREAIKALRRCQLDLVSGAIGQLRQALGDQDPGVREEAITTLAWLGRSASASVQALLRIASSKTDPLRTQADGALLRICPSGEQLDGFLDAQNAWEDFIVTLRELGAPARSLRLELEGLSRHVNPAASTSRDQALASSNAAVAEDQSCRLRPTWKKDGSGGGKLFLGDKLARTVAPKAKNLITLLDAFEEDGWGDRIDDPLPSLAMHETLRSLNKGLTGLKFVGDGSGKGICWR